MKPHTKEALFILALFALVLLALISDGMPFALAIGMICARELRNK